jgi:hypothetical protein
VKKMVILFLIFLLAVNFLGCEQAVYSVQLKQPANEIKSISFVDNPKAGTPEVVAVIESESAINEVVAALENLEVGRYRNDPPTSCGYLYIEIQYKNGDIEVIGTDSFMYTSTDGRIDDSYGGWYYVKLDSMRELFLKYSK